MKLPDTLFRRPALDYSDWSNGSKMTSPSPVRLAPTLTPHGRLLLAASDDAPELEPALAERIRRAFARGAGHGLLQLGAAEVGTVLPPALRVSGASSARATSPRSARTRDGDDARARPFPRRPTTWRALAAAAPPMPGAEYLTAERARLRSGRELDAAFHAELAESEAHRPGVSQAAEPGVEPGRPRALQPRREPQGRGGAVRLPRDLHHAAVGARPRRSTCRSARRCASTRARPTRTRLLSLLLPVQRAAETLRWLQAMVDAGEIYHPLRWTPAEALQLCSDVPQLEARRRGGAHARGLAREPPAAAAGDGDGRRQAARRARAGRAARLPAWRSRSTASALTDAEIAAAARRHRRARAASAAAGSRSTASSSRACSSSFREVERAAAEGGLHLRRGDAPARRRGRRRRRAPRRGATATGRRSSPARGSPRRSRGCAARRGSRASIRARRCTATLRPYQQVGVRWLHLLVAARPRRLPRRRHGPRQDHPGARAAARAAARSATANARPEPAGRARVAARQLGGRDRALRARACRRSIAHPSALPAAELQALDAGDARRTSTW